MDTLFRTRVCAIVGAAAVAFTMVGCTVPQTRLEFVAAVRASSWAHTSSAAADRPFDLVARDLNAFTAICLDIDIESTGSGTLMTGNRSYVGTFHLPRHGHGEITVRRIPGDMGAPPGGSYVLAVDVDATGPATTQAMIYGPVMGWDDVFEAVASVMRGELPPCPSLP